MTGTYRIANQTIQITSLYGDIHEQCMAFRVDAAPDYKIATTGADIEAQWEKLIHQESAQRHSMQRFSEAAMESYAILDEIAELCLKDQKILLYGSAVKTNGEGFLFLSDRSFLKAFFANLWMNTDVGGGSVLLNNNTSMIEVSENEVTVYSIPWHRGRAGCVNQSVPLKAICLLKSGKRNAMNRLEGNDAQAVLLEHSFSPTDEFVSVKRQEIINMLLSRVKLYRFESNMDHEAVHIAYNLMSMERY